MPKQNLHKEDLLDTLNLFHKKSHIIHMGFFVIIYTLFDKTTTYNDTYHTNNLANKPTITPINIK